MTTLIVPGAVANDAGTIINSTKIKEIALMIRELWIVDLLTILFLLWFSKLKYYLYAATAELELAARCV